MQSNGETMFFGNVQRPTSNFQRRKVGFFFAVVLALLGFGSMVRAAESVLLDGVAAHVNQHVITIGDVLMAMEPERRQLIVKYNGSALQGKLDDAYHETLDGLIERFVVLDSYEKGKGRIPDWAVDKRADEVIQDSFEGDRSALLDALAVEGMTFADWRKKIEQQMIVASMRSTSIEQSSTITPEELQSYYAEHRDTYVTPTRVHLLLIALERGADSMTNGAYRVTAETVLARLQGGEDFGAVAREVSTGRKASEGGDWGWVDPAILRPELAQALETLEPGAVSEVIATDGEFYIVKLVQREESTIRGFADVQGEIENKLKFEHAQAGYKSWVARLKLDAYVKVFDVNLF